MACEFEFVLEGPRLLPGEGAGMGINRALSRARGRLWPPGALLICATLLATGAQAATVTTTADGGPGSLRQVVMDAANGETIYFAVTGEIDLTGGEIVIAVDLTIIGPGAEVLTINSAIGRAFNIAANAEVSISGLRILSGLQPEATDGTNGLPGAAVQGGAIINAGSLMLSNSVVNGTADGGAGGAGGSGGPGTMSMPDGGNGGNGGPGGAAQGGGIYNSGTLTITNCEIEGTSRGGAGGSGGAGGDGVGGAGVGGKGGKGGDGGAGGAAQGGAIYNGGQLEIDSCTLQGAAIGGVSAPGSNGGRGGSDMTTGGDGGVGSSGGSGGSAQGGGIYSAPGASLDIRNSAIVFSFALGGTASSAANGGNGGNAMTGAGGAGGIGGAGGSGGRADGGGIFAVGSLTIVNCTLSGDGTVSGNGAVGGLGGSGGSGGSNGGNGANGGDGGSGAPATGGGLFFASGDATVRYVTAAENHVTAGLGAPGGNPGLGGSGTTRGSDGMIGGHGLGGIAAGAGIFGSDAGTVSRTLLAHNDPTNCGGNFISGGFNLSSDNSCASIFNQPTDLPPNTDPKIGDLMLNPPGHTPTHALLSGSPAINHIPIPDCIEQRDQRGVFRPQGPGCDIGAYERVVAQTTPVVDHLGLLVLVFLLVGAGTLTLRARAARPGAA